MRTYLSILKVLIIGYVSIINTIAQCALPPAGRCVANWTMASCYIPSSSNIYAYDNVTGTSINNPVGTSFVMTSNLVKINGTSVLRPGAKLVGATVPCTIQSKVLFYVLNTGQCSSIGQITGPSDINLPDQFPVSIIAACTDGTYDLCPTAFGTWKSTVLGTALSNNDGTYITGNCGSGVANQVLVSTSYTNATFHVANSCPSFCQAVFNNSKTYYTNSSVDWPKLRFVISSSTFNCANGGCVGVSVTANPGLREGLDEIEYTGSTIYPNPNDGSFTLILPSSEAYAVSISDLLGNVILTENVSNILTKDYKLNNLTNGMYIVNVTGNGVQKRTKVQLIK